MKKEDALALLRGGQSDIEAFNAYRAENPGWRPDLAGADLREAILTGTDLRGADLHRAIMYWAKVTASQAKSIRNSGASALDQLIIVESDFPSTPQLPS
jgi:uncharacterized protein YjbI with pentapeptide repeats